MVADKRPRQIMLSKKVRDYLDAMPAGTRSELVNDIMERYVDRQAKKVKT